MSIIEHLDADALTSVASALANDDVLAFSLCARALRTAQVAAKRKLKTNVRVVHWGTAALHLWAKSLGAPQPLSTGGMVTFSGFFNSLRIERGHNWALSGKDDASHLQKSSAHRELSEDEYDSVAYPGPTIAFAHEHGKYVSFLHPEEYMSDEIRKRDGLMYHQEKGFFTVRDVCAALAEYESGNITQVTRRYDWFYLAHLQCCGFEGGTIATEAPATAPAEPFVPIFHSAWHGFEHPHLTDSSIIDDE